jgi:hypothetical protein
MSTENKNHYELKMMRKEKNAMKEYHNDLKRIDDNQLKLYQQPLAEILDLRKYTLEELKNNRYDTKEDYNYYVRTA